MKVYNEKLHKYINIFIYFLLYIAVLFTVLDFCHNFVIFDDDKVFSTYVPGEKLFDCLSFLGGLKFDFIHGAGYIGLFLTKFLSFKIPLILGMHPQDFVIYHQIIKSIFLFLLIIVVSKFFNIYIKSKYLWSLTAFALIFYIVYSVLKTDSFIFICNYNFYRYLLSIIFYAGFWYIIFKNLLGVCKTDYKLIILACFLAYTIGCSSEIEACSSLILVCLIFLYNIFIFIINKFFNNNIFEKYKLNLSRTFYIPVLFLILSVIFVSLSSGFKHVADERQIYSIAVTFEFFKEFSFIFFKYCFKDIYVFWIIDLTFMILSFISAFKNKDIKSVVLPLLLQSAILFSMYSLIVCGKSNYGRTFIEHNNVLFLYMQLLVLPLLIFMSYVYKNIKNKKFVYLFVLFLISIFSFFIFNIFISTGKNIASVKKNVINTYTKSAYTVEKILRFYYLQDKIPVIPYYQCLDWTYNYYGKREYDPFITTQYYPIVYKSDISQKLNYIYDDNALDIFYKNGGVFSDSEFENMKFSRLLDDNFVLNKK